MTNRVKIIFGKKSVQLDYSLNRRIDIFNGNKLSTNATGNKIVLNSLVNL